MVEQSFKERVRLKLMDCAVLYYELLVQKDYLIFSRNFRYQKYYIVSAFEDNFLHLTGVHTNLKAKKFFEKCYQKTLEDGDFEINDKSQKGSVRRKMSVLENAIQIFSSEAIVVEENFNKNRISCSFASSDKVCTIGFTKTKLAKPQTILKGYQLHDEVKVDFILSRNKGEKDFQTVVYNALNMKLEECMELIKTK